MLYLLLHMSCVTAFAADRREGRCAVNLCADAVIIFWSMEPRSSSALREAIRLAEMAGHPPTLINIDVAAATSQIHPFLMAQGIPYQSVHDADGSLQRGMGVELPRVGDKTAPISVWKMMPDGQATFIAHTQR